MIRAVCVLIVLLSGGVAAAQSLTLSPAVVPLSGSPGQSTTQRLTLTNGTSQPLSFALLAKDVAVRDGARVFVDAGELRGSVAATAVFSTRSVAVGPGEQRSVTVTLTLPAQMTCRGVVILFQGTTRISGDATVSIGSLLTFDLSGKQSVAIGDLHVDPPTASANAQVSVPLINDGSEPAIARGAAAIITSSGTIVGKLALTPRRVLPGEHAALQADYAAQLAHGHYRVIATVESAQRSWTRSAELTVP
jgi:hypothetical protein